MAHAGAEGGDYGRAAPARENGHRTAVKGIVFYLMRSESLARSARTALRLAAHGAFGEIGRRLTRSERSAGLVQSLPAVPLKPRAAEGPVRIVAFGPSLAMEGAPLSLFELLRGLKEHEGFETISVAAAGGTLRRRYDQAGILCKTETAVDSAPLTLRDHVRNVERLARAFEAARADVVIANTVLAHAAVEAAHGAGIPALWILRESEPWPGVLGGLSGAVQDRAQATLRAAWRLVFVAQSTRDAWSALAAPELTVVIENALDGRRLAPPSREEARRALGLADGDAMILSVGTVSARKGQADAIKAMEALPSRAILFLVGDRESPESAALHRMAQSGPASARIRFVRETDDVSSYYAAADVFLSCSRFESYPRAILEALAAKLPIVTTPVFGIREQVEEGRSALFYSPGDVAALRAVLSRLMGDAQLRGALSDGAAARAAALPSFDAVLAKYGALVRSAVAARP